MYFAFVLAKSKFCKGKTSLGVRVSTIGMNSQTFAYMEGAV